MDEVLITGGAGFIGSNLAHELYDRDVVVHVLDSEYLGTFDNVASIMKDDTTPSYYHHDSTTQPDAVQRIMDKYDIDTVFHNAARSSAPMHTKDAVDGADINVTGFVNVMEAARNHGVGKVMYASTSTMYGSVDPPHEENMGEEPRNLYSASKMSRELYANVYSKFYGIDTVGLRYFSVYGPREQHKGQYANLVSQFIWKMMDGEQPVIYGDGTQTRDFTFVKDIVRGNICAAEAGVSNEVLNLGTNTETTLNELVSMLNVKLGTDIEPKHVENPIDNYVQRTKAVIEKARETIGYEPEHTLDEGIEETIDWYRDRD